MLVLGIDLGKTLAAALATRNEALKLEAWRYPAKQLGKLSEATFVPWAAETLIGIALTSWPTPDLVVVEANWYHRREVHPRNLEHLSDTRGVIIAHCAERGIRVEIADPATMQRATGIRKDCRVVEMPLIYGARILDPCAGTRGGEGDAPHVADALHLAHYGHRLLRDEELRKAIG
jgi:hypothetical protein